MYADVSLNVQRSGDALAVPVQAVDQSSSQSFVMLVDSNNIVEKRAVRVGIAGANLVEILTGLNAGDKVIIANLATFQPGQVVTPKLSAMSDVKNSEGDQ
jgi:multidrug efflux pump subunit AcrA (membrane-fusion protein)